MNKKMNFKKRLFAVFSVVLLLASLALGCVASAWSYTDAPFYNYFDNTKIALKDTLSNNAYVSAVNPEFGSITISMKYNGRKGLWVASYSNSDVTLRDLCPEMVVGETYVLGGNYGTVDLPVKFYNRIVLHDGTNYTVWEFGKSLVITAELLNCRVTYYLGEIAEDDTYFQNGQVYSIGLQLWINKGTVLEDFAPHNLGLAGYRQGYQDGYTSGLNQTLEDMELLTSDNFEMQIVYDDWDIPDGSYITYTFDNSKYNFDGFSFNTALLQPYFFRDFVAGVNEVHYISCYVDLANKDISLSKFLARFTIPNNNASAYAVTVYLSNGDYINYRFESSLVIDGAKVTEVDNSLLVTRIVFTYNEPYQLGNVSFSMTLGVANSLSYEIGYESGNNVGYVNGKSDGENIGYTKGEDAGYQKGYNYGFSQGKEQGYYQGVADEANQGGFFKLFYSVVDAPVQALLGLFSFDIFGFNMQTAFISVISLIAVIGIVMLLVKVKI